MKQYFKTLAAASLAMLASLSTSNAQDHDLKAPNGGRLVTGIEPHAEVYVSDDGVVQITFLGEEGEVIAPQKQLVTLVGGSRMDPIRLSFAKKGDSFVSEGVLPTDKPIPVVLQIQEKLGGSTFRERFQLNMSSCPTCEYKEYACVCHGDEEGEHGDEQEERDGEGD